MIQGHYYIFTRFSGLQLVADVNESTSSAESTSDLNLTARLHHSQRFCYILPEGQVMTAVTDSGTPPGCQIGKP